MSICIAEGVISVCVGGSDMWVAKEDGESYIQLDHQAQKMEA